ncbi:MAG: hypothetical protein ABIN69_12675, partial [Aestuariivirga sp.]
YVVRSSINVMDVFDVGLPKAISATVFSRWGFLLQFVLPFLIILLATTRRRPKNSTHAALY